MREADRKAVAATLGHAFATDPVFEWLVPRAQGRAERLARFFAAHVGNFMRLGSAFTVDGLAGAALWAPPGKWRLDHVAMAREAPGALRAFRGRTLRAAVGMIPVEKAHPRDPHWYLAVLGTHPAEQGKGVGSALIQPMLDRCDEEGLPAYLESSKEQNVPFYARHGFAVRQPVQIRYGGPEVWPMWRHPR